ncbi:hypothetical protein LINPERHAP2_LOCUS34543 [Linum perenne]
MLLMSLCTFGEKTELARILKSLKSSDVMPLVNLQIKKGRWSSQAYMQQVAAGQILMSGFSSSDLQALKQLISRLTNPAAGDPLVRVFSGGLFEPSLLDPLSSPPLIKETGK